MDRCGVTEDLNRHLAAEDALPEFYEVTDTVINDAVERASDEVFTEYLDGIHDVLKVAILPLCEIAIKDRVDDFLVTYKVEGKFR